MTRAIEAIAVASLRKLSEAVLVVFVVVSIVFFVSRVAADPINYLAPMNATQQDIANLRQAYGLDRPLYEQYGDFLLDTARLDIGKSLRSGRPAVTEVETRVGKTLELGGTALTLAFLVGVPLGVFAAERRGGWLDLVARLGALLGQAIPSFWLGLMLVFLFGVRLGWLPTGGTGSWKHLVLPAFTLAAPTCAAIVRLTRSGMITALSADFVRTARAKGLQERVVVTRHVLRHALLPVVTIGGIYVARVMGGAIVVETIFAWPGLGRLMVTSMQTGDFAVVQVGVMFIASLVVVVNAGVDLSYRFIDPRQRDGGLA